MVCLLEACVSHAQEFVLLRLQAARMFQGGYRRVAALHPIAYQIDKREIAMSLKWG
jgi:hypothetical protein